MLAEYFDQLTVIFIQEIIDKKKNLNENIRFFFEIKKFLKKYFKNKKITIFHIAYLNLLTMVNYDIYKLRKNVVLKNGKFCSKKLKLSHQINAVRNIIKNKISLLESKNHKNFKGNIDKENLLNYNLILLGRKYQDIIKKKYKVKRFKNVDNLSEELDKLTILQIKEKKIKYYQTKNYLIENIIKLSHFNFKNKISIFFYITLVSVLNNLIWDNKDEMKVLKYLYDDLLAEAQNLNSLKNEVINRMKKEFNEKSKRRTAIFYEKKFNKKIFFFKKIFKIKQYDKK